MVGRSSAGASGGNATGSSFSSRGGGSNFDASFAGDLASAFGFSFAFGAAMPGTDLAFGAPAPGTVLALGVALGFALGFAV